MLAFSYCTRKHMSGAGSCSCVYASHVLTAPRACRPKEQYDEMQTLLHPETGKPVDAGGEPVSEQCQICHMAVSYVRAAIENKETEAEIEKACPCHPVFAFQEGVDVDVVAWCSC
jgi:Saposin-like type B, region 1